jgi:hypothetical protein
MPSSESVTECKNQEKKFIKFFSCDPHEYHGKKQGKKKREAS